MINPLSAATNGYLSGLSPLFISVDGYLTLPAEVLTPVGGVRRFVGNKVVPGLVYDQENESTILMICQAFLICH